MARKKKSQPGVDLLGHLFGVPQVARVIRQQYTAFDTYPEQQKALLLTPVEQSLQVQPVLLTSSQSQPQLYPVPMLLTSSQSQPQISSGHMHQHSQQQQLALPQRQPTASELDELRRINETFRTSTGSNIAGKTWSPMGYNLDRNSANTHVNSTSITIAKHICVSCGRLRSHKYHHKNPIKPGDVPPPAFCGKCQKEATSTEGSRSRDSSRKKKDSKKTKSRNKAQRKKRDEVCISR